MEHPYHQFTSRDFVLDDAFRRWVLQPTPEDTRFWEAFLQRQPQQRPAVVEAAAVLQHLCASCDELPDASRQRIGQVLVQRFDQRRANEPLVRPLLGRGGFGWRVAASLTGLLLLAGATVWYVLRPRQEQIHTAYGETRTVTLPDGSTVLLNGNSTLRFAADWSTGLPREVWLDGEGFFHVTKQLSQRPDRPAGVPAAGAPVRFVTHTPSLDITVLGTQFNVNTRRGSTDVTLVEGKVQLSRPASDGSGDRSTKIIELKPGQFASAQPNTRNVAVQTEKPQFHTSWVQHRFVFDSTPLRDIANQLHDTYGLTIVMDDPELAGRRFTGNLSNEDIETLLTTLSITFNLDIKRTGDQVVFRQNL